MNHPLRGTFVGNSIVRLADEGVPIGALSRTFKIPYDSAHDIVRQAMEAGMIADMPAADWPAGSRVRAPTTSPIEIQNHPSFLTACKTELGLTLGEAKILQCLMQSTACTKPHLHSAVSPDAEPKIIDVFVCKIRAKLNKFQIQIKTIWGIGYAISDEDKRAIVARMGG
ncbi:winged helix-turn-helix domain-containing protein, partial [Pleomorphomonas oryzae]|uniref:winged helix-turn-helix domain-containing protein n=1 Tax=Pleomorphomonas oryzae TaxID=261934 RepID=UPI0006889A94